MEILAVILAVIALLLALCEVANYPLRRIEHQRSDKK